MVLLTNRVLLLMHVGFARPLIRGAEPHSVTRQALRTGRARTIDLSFQHTQRAASTRLQPSATHSNLAAYLGRMQHASLASTGFRTRSARGEGLRRHAQHGVALR